jgi:hypothetical protein
MKSDVKQKMRVMTRSTDALRSLAKEKTKRLSAKTKTNFCARQFSRWHVTRLALDRVAKRAADRIQHRR